MKRFFGVSPAFLLSLYGNDFIPEQVVEAVGIIKDLGFDSFQCEIVKKDKIALWEKGGAVKVYQAAHEANLNISQFVAHLMMDYFSNQDVLCSQEGLDEIRHILDICNLLNFKGQITVPVGPFDGIAKLSAEKRSYYTEKLIEKFRKIHEFVACTGNKMAVEVQPGSLIAGLDNIKYFINAVADDVGYNFDTGHAWASGALNLADFPEVLSAKIYGTHLCDNDGIINDSLCPGEGTINWEEVIHNLLESEYNGSWDLEIFTKPELTKENYLKGKNYLIGLLSEEKAVGS